ncbi:MAG: S8 family serine peptidase, partial [Bacteroidota bacterium]
VKTIQQAKQSLGLRPDQLRSISFGWQLEDGFHIYHTHEVVLRFKKGYDINSIQSLLDQYGASFLRKDFLSIVLDVEDVNNSLPLANAIMESGMAEFALPDIYAKLTHTNDPLFGDQFQMHNTGQTIDGFSGTNDADCNALEAWGITTGSSSITVAVIDDGVEAHEDLDTPLAGFSPANNGNGTPISNGAHGQACAGIIAANHNNLGVMGVAPDVNIITGNIFVGGESTQDLANTITWAKNQGADVMSNSWGYGSCTFSASNLTNALNDANSNGRGGLGCVIVFASGNDYQSCVSYPGNVGSVIGVGAFGNDGIKSDYSNAGPSLDISAPSNDISSAGFLVGAGVRTIDRMGSSGYSSTNYTTSFGGTSAACPVVAGVAALVLSVDGSLTSAQVKNILYTTAKDFGASGFDNSYGNGAVDAFAAVQAAGGSSGGGGNSCASTVSSFPYSESFESGTGAWTQASGDDLDWSRNSGGTPSSNTGPSSADDGSFYMYVEASSPNYPSKTTIFNGPCFDLGGVSNPEFSFSYHMLGNAVGTLTLQASTDGSNWTSVWSESGTQGSAWNSTTVSLSAYAGQSEVRLRYVGTTANSWQGDMCIDNLSLVDAGSGGGGGCTDTEVTLSLVLDNYPGETTWSIVNGSGATVASGGPYSTAGASVSETFCLPDGCYDFVINDSYGDGICCAYGNGSYSLDAGGTNYASGGNFGSSETTNFCVGGGGPATCPAVDFNAYTISSYSNQDITGTNAIQNGGATLALSNNTWKYISFNYTVTASTVLEFDFRSTSQGEIHGVGFDNDNSLSSNTIFKVHGTQNWGITNYDNYSGSSWTTYSIPVGSSFTGSFDRLVFVNDNDAGSGNTSQFRNVKVYESGSCASGSAMVMTTSPQMPVLGTEAENVLNIFPNPVQSNLQLAFNSGDDPLQVSVRDITGREVMRVKLEAGKRDIQVSELANGTYFLQVTGPTGSAVEKFVKTK